MTLQTTAPLVETHLSATARTSDWFRLLRDDEGPDERHGNLELNPPYQRGDVWTADQRRLLIKSFLLGVPVPSVIVNDRMSADFRHPDGGTDWRIAVVDGKQRVTTVLAWFDDQLDVPASWFPEDRIQNTVATDDGPYVRNCDLTEAARRLLRNRMMLPVCEARLSSLAAEAALYLLVNRGGTEHSDADLDTARQLSR